MATGYPTPRHPVASRNGDPRREAPAWYHRIESDRVRRAADRGRFVDRLCAWLAACAGGARGGRSPRCARHDCRSWRRRCARRRGRPAGAGAACDRRARGDSAPSDASLGDPATRGPPAGGGRCPGPAFRRRWRDDPAAVRRGSVDARDLPSRDHVRRSRRGDPDQAAGRLVLLRRRRPRRRDPRLVPRPGRIACSASASQAGAFAAFGPSLRVRGARMTSPGGPAADPLWKELVGASPADADAFVDKLLGARFGRLAWLYDTVSRLDPGLQRHLLDRRRRPRAAASAGRRLRPASTRNGGSRTGRCGVRWSIRPRCCWSSRPGRTARRPFPSRRRGRARSAARRRSTPPGWSIASSPAICRRSAIASSWRCSRCAGHATAARRRLEARSTSSRTRRRWR